MYARCAFVQYIGLRVNYCYCKILTKFDLSRENFENFSNTEFHENASSGSRVFPFVRTDRHDDPNNRLSQFCERASNAIPSTKYGTTCRNT